jgi:hypothetical protein
MCNQLPLCFGLVSLYLKLYLVPICLNLFHIAIGDRKVPCYQLYWPENFFIVMGSSMREGENNVG